jgi:hypothetical protein
MADLTLAELLMRPVMPEEYDTKEPEGLPYLRAFGAGVVDPMGIPSWAYNKLSGSPNSDWYTRRMQEARDESPILAGMGSAVPMAPLGVGYMAARNALTLPFSYSAAPGAALRSIGELLGPSMLFGGAMGQLREELSPPPRPQRPQGAYPPGGAY